MPQALLKLKRIQQRLQELPLGRQELPPVRQELLLLVLLTPLVAA